MLILCYSLGDLWDSGGAQHARPHFMGEEGGAPRGHRICWGQHTSGEVWIQIQFSSHAPE